ncbi:hypothetical protein [Ramlibacter humi]|uniref:Uncharacterized protein n=1 Tax=Ramlibacter humi TaxID=2530451 RepID=A0A4Z0BI91_9BURK|nr:hypothetical protein [Ramlibacter humi]TFY97618.1 hypothetical protein EZ216_17985 [Ramlibacter humi]
MKPEPSDRHRKFVRNAAPERNEQAPLGPHPSYDEVLDVGVEYTFPASDPVAVQSSAKDAAEREERRGQRHRDRPR